MNNEQLMINSFHSFSLSHILSHSLFSPFMSGRFFPYRGAPLYLNDWSLPLSARAIATPTPPSRSGGACSEQSGFPLVKKWAIMECSGIPMESVIQTKKSQFWRRMLKAPPLNPLTYIFSVFCSILPPSYWDQTNTIILTALSLVYIIISINVGLRNKRGSF